MKQILNLIDTSSSVIKEDHVYLTNKNSIYEIEVNCDFSNESHSIEVYNKKNDKVISINDNLFDKIVNHCFVLLKNNRNNRFNSFTSEDYAHFESLIHRG